MVGTLRWTVYGFVCLLCRVKAFAKSPLHGFVRLLCRVEAFAQSPLHAPHYLANPMGFAP